jgi:hypothetical protein
MAFFSRKSRPAYSWKLHENWRTAIEEDLSVPWVLSFKQALLYIRVYPCNPWSAFLVFAIGGKSV